MPSRRNSIVEEEVHHVFTKSIAGYKIFNSRRDFQRIVDALAYYSLENPPCKFAYYQETIEKNRESKFQYLKSDERIVRIIAYCIMPTHIHLMLEQLEKEGISRYMNLILKSYSLHFNIKHKRKGPLWEGRFKNVRLETDEQFLHLTRYIHLNPVSAGIVDHPKDWQFSSYREYLGLVQAGKMLCDYDKFFDMSRDSYKGFVTDQIDCQRELEKIKHVVIE